MINRAVLTGRLTKDPELRYTNSGTAVTRFNLAVDRQFRNKQTGEREADFISCVIWRKSAENFVSFTHKGALIGIDGRITTSNYENQQGQRVYRTEVTVENFALLEPRSANTDNYQSGNQGYGGYGNGYNNSSQYSNSSNGSYSAPQGNQNSQWVNDQNQGQNGSQSNYGANNDLFSGQPQSTQEQTMNIQNQPINTDGLPFDNPGNQQQNEQIKDVPF